MNHRKKPIGTLIAVLALLLLVSACSTKIDGEDYLGTEPKFDLAQFFDGNVKAWGIVQDRSGAVVQRFVVEIKGRVDNGQIVLDETFEYGVGTGPLTRVWTISEQPSGKFTGKADDIIGVATGTSFGNAFNFTYEMDLSVGDSVYRVAFDDWFWAFDDSTMMNRSYIKKFGIVMAEVTIFMQRQE